MAALGAIADRHGLMIVEDAAQGLGSRFRGRMAGTFGRFGTLSFYPAKLLGCFGDGGAVMTNDDEVAGRLALLRDHGRNAQGKVVAWGFNSRLDNLQAAILDFRLGTFGQDIDRRRAIAARYQDRLGDLVELVLPPPPVSDGDHFDVYQNFEIEAEHRDALKEYLSARGVGTLVQWGGAAVHQFRELGFDQTLPATERMMQRALMLPMNLSVSDADVDYICSCIRDFYRSGGQA